MAAPKNPWLRVWDLSLICGVMQRKAMRTVVISEYTTEADLVQRV